MVTTNEVRTCRCCEAEYETPCSRCDRCITAGCWFTGMGGDGTLYWSACCGTDKIAAQDRNGTIIGGPDYSMIED